MERYSVHKVIGEGSFGRALLVRCKNSQEEYVLKEVPLPKNQSKVENSRREAILLSRMKHPNIVAFREAFEADCLLCIVMEFCSGGDLLQRIRQQKATLFPVDDILRWFAQMCAGTKHIHDKRVLHRDLKAKNIFLTDNGTIKLGDFGSACLLNSSKAYAQTYVGTPYYVSPEIWDNKPYNNKSAMLQMSAHTAFGVVHPKHSRLTCDVTSGDVWSLGCVLYELCTLRHPFQASSWKALILKVCRGAYPPLPRHLPYELHYLLKHMFKTNPKDRPSVHTILTSHRISRLLHEHLPSQASDAEERGRRKRRWRREEGAKVADHLGQKSLVTTSTFEGAKLAEAPGESREPAPRRQWAAGPSDSVLQVLGDARLLSSHSVASEDAGPEEWEEGGRRRRWERSPPERLLSLLEKVQLSAAFSTYSIHGTGASPLVGPLSQTQGDDTDGPEDQVAVDEERLESRSDDEDTDFEEDSPCDWIDELEKMFSDR